MHNTEEIVAKLESLAEETREAPLAETDLRQRVWEILGDHKITPEAKEKKDAVLAAFRAGDMLMGKAFRAMCEKLGITNYTPMMRLAGGVVYEEVDGAGEIAPEVLGALGTGCVEDPGPLAYLLEPDASTLAP